MNAQETTRANGIERRLLDYQEAARYLGISPVGLYRHVRGGSLSVVRLGRSVRFDVCELDRFVDRLAEQQQVVG